MIRWLHRIVLEHRLSALEHAFLRSQGMTYQERKAIMERAEAIRIQLGYGAF